MFTDTLFKARWFEKMVPFQVLRQHVVDSSQSAILAIYCDAVTSAVICETLCLPTHSVSSLSEFRSLHRLNEPLGIIIDAANCKDTSWTEVLRIAAQTWEFCARIVLSRPGDDEQMELAFFSGCHDVIRKPLNTRELLARFQVRSSELTLKFKTSTIRFSDLTINPVNRTVQTSIKQVQLSQTAFSVLLIFLEEPDKVITRETFKERVWGGTQVVDGVIDRHIHDIRRALSESGSVLSVKSVYGEGFKLTHAEIENSKRSKLK